MPDLNTCGELADYLAAQPRDRKIVPSKDARLPAGTRHPEGFRFPDLLHHDQRLVRHLADRTGIDGYAAWLAVADVAKRRRDSAYWELMTQARVPDLRFLESRVVAGSITADGTSGHNGQVAATDDPYAHETH